jgi:hypothetical protein
MADLGTPETISFACGSMHWRGHSVLRTERRRPGCESPSLRYTSSSIIGQQAPCSYQTLQMLVDQLQDQLQDQLSFIRLEHGRLDELYLYFHSTVA